MVGCSGRPSSGAADPGGQVQSALTQATTQLYEEAGCGFAAIDGTARTLTDWRRRKGFGAVGSNALGARGLKVFNAYAIFPQLTPPGVLG